MLLYRFVDEYQVITTLVEQTIDYKYPVQNNARC